MPAALIFALALTGAGSPDAPASPPGFCTVLDAIIAAAHEPTPFRSLSAPADYGNQAWSTQVVPGFAYCSLTTTTIAGSEIPTVSCWRRMAPRDLTANSLALETGSCLGEAPTPSVWDPTVGEMVFNQGPVRIVIEESCTDQCHVGRLVTYRIEARRPE